MTKVQDWVPGVFDKCGRSGSTLWKPKVLNLFSILNFTTASKPRLEDRGASTRLHRMRPRLKLISLGPFWENLQSSIQRPVGSNRGKVDPMGPQERNSKKTKKACNCKSSSNLPGSSARSRCKLAPSSPGRPGRPAVPPERRCRRGLPPPAPRRCSPRRRCRPCCCQPGASSRASPKVLISVMLLFCLAQLIKL